jgi:hypothetical protein
VHLRDGLRRDASLSLTYSGTAAFNATQAHIPVGGQKNLSGSYTSPEPERPRTEEDGDSQDVPCIRENGCSPIIINFTGAYALSGLDDPVAFDIDADGRKERIGWTERASDEAFLVLDRNRDGKINDGRELFGDAVILRDGARGEWVRSTAGARPQRRWDHQPIRSCMERPGALAGCRSRWHLGTSNAAAHMPIHRPVYDIFFASSR